MRALDNSSGAPPAIPDQPELDVCLVIRVSKETRANLAFFAAEESRPVSSLCRNVLKGWCRNRRRKRGWDAG